MFTQLEHEELGRYIRARPADGYEVHDLGAAARPGVGCLRHDWDSTSLLDRGNSCNSSLTFGSLFMLGCWCALAVALCRWVESRTCQ